MENLFVSSITFGHFFSFITLSFLEIILGIDNLIFISLLVQTLPTHQRTKARLIGLSLALALRIFMLLGLAWIISLTQPIFTIFEIGISYRDLLLLAGGLFLIMKSTLEMHQDIASISDEKSKFTFEGKRVFVIAIIQIIFIDLVFSFDSVITAIGMTTNVPIIVAAMTVAMLVMIVASKYVADFLDKYPTFKILALSFILMIGTLLMAEGLHFHVPRGYIYFAFAFSIFVEILNSLAKSKREKGK